jgi:hypothetical protein
MPIEDGMGLLNDGLRSAIIEIVPTIEKNRLYRGRGGEVMRGAACTLLEAIGSSLVPAYYRYSYLYLIMSL